MQTPVYALVDCNNFFVSCERVFRPDLWDKPVAVLSNNDGCIVARSNEVKALNIPMGVPHFKVKNVLNNNNVTLFSGNFALYGDFSQRVVSILQQECAAIEVYSVDESFLDISDMALSNYMTWAQNVRQKILQWTGIPVSIDIAPTKTLAKAAADYAKKHPKGQGVHMAINPRARQSLLEWLPVQDIWGVGWRTAPVLQARGVRTACDVVQVGHQWLRRTLGVNAERTVRELQGQSCYGLDYNTQLQHSIIRTRSFGHYIREYHQLESAVATFAAQAAAKLRQQNGVTGSVMAYVRTSRYTQQQATRQVSYTVSLQQPTSDTGAIIAAAISALNSIYDPDFSYKKAGVGLLQLRPTQQLAFTTNTLQLARQQRLMATVDNLTKRYGQRIVRHASEHVGRSQWQSKHMLRSPAYTSKWQQLPLVST